jgi:hypothetical protein
VTGYAEVTPMTRPHHFFNLAHRLRATAMEGGRAHDSIHRGFQSDRVGRDLDPDYPVGIRRPALPEEAGGTLALGTVSIRASSRESRIAAALYFAWFIMAVVRAIYILVVFLQSGGLQPFRFVAWRMNTTPPFNSEGANRRILKCAESLRALR